MRTLFSAFFCTVGLFGLTACASQGDFPSLAPRPIERALAETEDEPRPAPIPDDAQLPAELQRLVAQGRRGQAEFDAALATARSAVARAGKQGSDSWMEAQQALSRLQAARSATAKAMADLDAFEVARAQASSLSAADLERLNQATAALQAVSEAQEREIGALKARLRG